MPLLANWIVLIDLCLTKSSLGKENGKLKALRLRSLSVLGVSTCTGLNMQNAIHLGCRDRDMLIQSAEIRMLNREREFELTVVVKSWEGAEWSIIAKIAFRVRRCFTASLIQHRRWPNTKYSLWMIDVELELGITIIGSLFWKVLKKDIVVSIFETLDDWNRPK